MRKTINKIREQPLHVREAIMWISVIVVFSIIGVVWFSNFHDQSYALLNPQGVQGDDAAAVAKGEKQEASPFAALLSAFGNIGSGISGFVSSLGEESEQIEEPHILPISE